MYYKINNKETETTRILPYHSQRFVLVGRQFVSFEALALVGKRKACPGNYVCSHTPRKLLLKGRQPSPFASSRRRSESFQALAACCSLYSFVTQRVKTKTKTPSTTTDAIFRQPPKKQTSGNGVERAYPFVGFSLLL